MNERQMTQMMGLAMRAADAMEYARLLPYHEAVMTQHNNVVSDLAGYIALTRAEQDPQQVASILKTVCSACFLLGYEAGLKVRV